MELQGMEKLRRQSSEGSSSYGTGENLLPAKHPTWGKGDNKQAHKELQN